MLHSDETWSKSSARDDGEMHLRQSWEGPLLEATLPGGETVVVRPLQADDEPALRVGFAELSPATRYHRFHAHVAALTEAQWRYLTQIDGDRHVALVALIGERLVGVVRLIQLPDDADAAEVAFIVADEMQGRRLGTIMRDAVFAIARARAYRRLYAYVLPDNRAIRRLLAVDDAVCVDRGTVLELVFSA